MSNELIIRPDEIQATETMAKYAVESKFFQKLGGMPAIFTIMTYAKEMGLNPMQCLFGGMNSVLGKIEISPVMMNAMIRKAGHKLEIVTHNNNQCTIKGTRKDTGESATVTFHIEDAKRAGIWKEGGGWTKYPQDMLFARTISRLGRRLFPDVIGGMYVEGEISGEAQEVSLQEAVETVNISEEETGENPSDIPMEKACEIISSVTGLSNDENLHLYVTSCVVRTSGNFRDFANKCAENKEKFISFYGAWCEKQASDNSEKTTPLNS